MGLPFLVEPLLEDETVGIATFYPQAFSPDGRYIICEDTSSDRTILTLDRTDDSCITAFGAGGGGLNLVIDDDGTVYSLDTAGTLCSWPDFARGSQTVLASDALLAVSGGLGLFVMPDDTRKIAWLGGGTGAGSKDISIYDVETSTLTTVANGTPTGLTQFQQILQDRYGDVWAVGADTDSIYFQRVIDAGAGSAAPDFNTISDPGQVNYNHIEAYHTSSGWFVVRGGGTDLFLFADADFSQLAHRSYAVSGSVLNSAQDAGSPFLMGLAPGQTAFWFPGPNSYANGAYSDLHNIVAADLSTAATHDITDWDISDIPDVTRGMVLSTHTRLALISMQNGDNATAPAYTTVIRYFPADDVTGGDGDGVTDDDVTIRVWEFSLDGHDFYVLRLGPSETLVYDLTANMWSSWASPGRDNWRAHVGTNWVGMRATTLDRGFGTDVVAGDDATGTLWILDPTTGRDDRTTTDSDAFTRVTTGGIQVTGRDVIPCGAVTIDLSIGAPTQTGATIMLESSDDLGHSWNNHGSNIIAAGDYSATIEYRSLGTIKAPGRIFRITDNGATVRLSGADMR
jgi:hypothetical protein